MSALISIVVPTHNERQNVDELHRRIVAVFKGLEAYDFEIIFVDDSTDDTPEIIGQLCAADARVKLVRLTRKFGQSIALTAGLERARGAAVIMMDADLQDPPEAIPLLVAEWRAGNDVVYVERGSSPNSMFYKIFAKIFYRLLRVVANVPIPVDAGEFRLLDRRVVAVMNRFTERTRFMRGLTLWPGFKSSKIKITRAERLHGVTNYNFRRSALVAIDGFISFSITPLRFASLLGASFVVMSMIGVIYALCLRLFTNTWSPGWTLMFIAIMIMGGLQFILLGIMGEYIGRIFLEVQNRPLYVVDYETGFSRPEDQTNDHGAP